MRDNQVPPPEHHHSAPVSSFVHACFRVDGDTVLRPNMTGGSLSLQEQVRVFDGQFHPSFSTRTVLEKS